MWKEGECQYDRNMQDAFNMSIAKSEIQETCFSSK
jgi:hypothetical protein